MSFDNLLQKSLHFLLQKLDVFGWVRVYEGLRWLQLALIIVVAAGALVLLWRRQRSWGMAFVGVALLATLGLQVINSVLAGWIGPGRVETVGAMLRRPGDPWPKGDGHVPLGRLGARETEKGYLEPGGSFSPAAGSFGVALWIYDSSGRLLTTSDTIPSAQTRANYLNSQAGTQAIRTDTPYYSATWTADDDGGFTLEAGTDPARDLRVDVMVRSVGPAGGRLEAIERRGPMVVTPSGWALSGIPVDASWACGEEGRAGWIERRADGPLRTTSASGWAFGRIGMPTASFSLRVEKVNAGGLPPGIQQMRRQGESVVLQGMEPEFVAALHAQIATLKQGLVGLQSRPGDPLNYPLDWLRDGAYVVVALLRSGEVDLARRLGLELARKDYFGGFGAEADSLGLALWTLGELSRALQDEAFDREVLPHVRRKAEGLAELFETTGKTEQNYEGSVVPRYRSHPDLRLVATGTRQGLIVGRMDWHYPLFYVNASAIAGLTAAAEIAKRLSLKDEAARWADRSAKARRDWRRAFDDPGFAQDRGNERTAISGLWPFEVAEPNSFARLMEERLRQDVASRAGQPASRPLWTYFIIAEAHQWLLLGRPDIAWSSLKGLWQQSPFPGLYTFWEGRGEENTFHLWPSYRGWVNPAYVTPHYWAAAEALLLQLAMMAESYPNDDGRTTLMIGAGVQREWLDQPLRAAGIGTSIGPVSWSWENGKVTVQVPQRWMPLVDVRLGSAFAISTPVLVVEKAGSGQCPSSHSACSR